ncbi:MAG: hypothetical protein QM733_01325 [Ilumatobacteraceae bacterium]
MGIPLEDVQTPMYRPASIWRRVWSLVAGSAIAVVTGALLATVLGFGIAYAVVRFSDMLKR